MKGISTVLATVLIVVITVAIIGMAYGWATGMFKMTTSGATDETESQIAKMQKSVQIISATCDGTDLTFTIKASGSKDLLGTELTAFVNEELSTATFNDLVSGSSEEYTLTDGIDATLIADINILKIDAPAGSIEEEVVC